MTQLEKPHQRYTSRSVPHNPAHSSKTFLVFFPEMLAAPKTWKMPNQTNPRPSNKPNNKRDMAKGWASCNFTAAICPLGKNSVLIKIMPTSRNRYFGISWISESWKKTTTKIYFVSNMSCKNPTVTIQKVFAQQLLHQIPSSKAGVYEYKRLCSDYPTDKLAFSLVLKSLLFLSGVWTAFTQSCLRSCSSYTTSASVGLGDHWHTQLYLKIMIGSVSWHGPSQSIARERGILKFEFSLFLPPMHNWKLDRKTLWFLEALRLFSFLWNRFASSRVWNSLGGLLCDVKQNLTAHWEVEGYERR